MNLKMSTISNWFQQKQLMPPGFPTFTIFTLHLLSLDLFFFENAVIQIR